MENYEDSKEKMSKIRRRLFWIGMLAAGILGYKLGEGVCNYKTSLGLAKLSSEDANFKEALSTALANHYKNLLSKE